MASRVTHAVGVDIGGTGIKGGVVDLATGQLTTERIKVATPKGAEPDAVLDAVKQVLDTLGVADSDMPLGVAFPAVVKNGITLSAANVAPAWIGFAAEAFFEHGLGRGIHFANDADVAGIAEVRYGAAKNAHGLTMLTTLGTGIGTAMLWNGTLVPNTELGHIPRPGHEKDFEWWCAYSAKERDDLDWKDWAARLQKYYETIERLFSPDLIVVGGGVSKYSGEFLPLLKLTVPIVPAVHRNNAGIIGAAALALADDAPEDAEAGTPLSEADGDIGHP